MHSIIVSFFVALMVGFFIIKLSVVNEKTLDYELNGAQKFHSHPVPRIGGLAIFIAVAAGGGLAYWRAPHIGAWIFLLLLSSTLAFGSGILEDWTKNVGVLYRLIFTLLSAVVGYFLLHAAIVRIDVSFIDSFLRFAPVSLLFTVLCVAGIANGINIIDGFNGLAGAISIFIALSLAYVSMQVGDAHVTTAALVLAGATAGFMIWNYPFGLIFLGDGGAYFLGFMLAELAVLLIARNPQVSAWYAALLMIYPAFEVIFSIYRKKFVRGISPGIPDGVHLHMLVFKRLVRWTLGTQGARAKTRRNALTSPYLWLLSLTAIIPATLFWHSKWVLVGFSALFVVGYTWLYAQIVRFNAPQWMILRKKK
ncbi:glycosyltransferase [Noviherbaspirillum sp.]|uniref:MraY family glycosyltransferase n=1 Tax=Noviherbaspirillum sp. TaxID=1926288 RepID=UPI002B45AC4E|nr:glycosyltransferase [Noviherbaspirillum sp.]HJV83656.1 glycosyltransferase [Noviherbaspirillum sp.]